MLEIFCKNMNRNDYLILESDYNALVNYRKFDIWRKAYIEIDNKIFIKDFFDRLENKFDYISYKYNIMNNLTIKAKLSNTLNNRNIEYAFLNYLHYSIESYLAFMIEFILAGMIKEIYGGLVFRDKRLDCINKIDLLYNNQGYQIKNYSFIERNDKTESYINKYKGYNLKFIFYLFDDNNIYFCIIDDKPFLSYEDINAWTVHKGYKKISVYDYIKFFEKGDKFE